MLTFFYRLFIFSALLVVVTGAAFGLAALAPGAATFPFFFLVLLIPALAFMAFTYQVIYNDTLRRVSNRGWLNLADRMKRDGRNLDNVNAHKANLARLNLEGFSLRSADLAGVKMNGTSATSIDMSKAYAEKMRMNRGIFKYGRFKNTNLRKSRMRYADFTGANFTGADLRGCNLKGANLKKANLKGADLKGAIFSKKTKLPFSTEQALDRGMVFV